MLSQRSCRLDFSSTPLRSARILIYKRAFFITSALHFSSTFIAKNEQGADAKAPNRPNFSYQRISISPEDDNDRLYPLIRAYINEPRLADSVTEIVIPQPYPNNPFLRFDLKDTAFPSANTNLSLKCGDESHAAVEQHVKSLGLENENTERVIRSLRWHRDHRYKLETNWALYKVGEKTFEFTLGAAAILLSLCKNVEKLYLGHIRLPMDSPLRDYLLRANYSRTKVARLQRLKAVEVLSTGETWSGYIDNMDESEFLEYFQFVHRLPSIDSITMDGVYEHQPWRERFPPRCSNIRKIYFKHCDISSRLFSTIVSTSKTLEELTLSRGGLKTRDTSIHFFFMRTLGKALLEYRTTLKKLDLNSQAYRGEEETIEDSYGDDPEDQKLALEHEGNNDERWHKGEYLDVDTSSSAHSSLDHPDSREYGITIGSLHDFEALTHLSINIVALLGKPESERANPREDYVEPPFKLVDGLPPNLEYLRLYDYTKGAHKDIDDQVQQLLAVRQQRYPRLKVIEGVDQTVPGMLTQYPGAIGWDDDKVHQRPERSDLGWKEA